MRRKPVPNRRPTNRPLTTDELTEQARQRLKTLAINLTHRFGAVGTGNLFMGTAAVCLKARWVGTKPANTSASWPTKLQATRWPKSSRRRRGAREPRRGSTTFLERNEGPAAGHIFSHLLFSDVNQTIVCYGFRSVDP
jgi:hypothetical protein